MTRCEQTLPDADYRAAMAGATTSAHARPGVIVTPASPAGRSVVLMGAADGNGWVACRCGRRHWGVYGAAGLLLHRRDPHPGTANGDGQVLLQLRAPWVHQGGTWAAPGGALDSHESPVEAALREAEEEAGIRADDVRVHGVLVGTDHEDWRYDLVLATVVGRVRPVSANAESSSVQWVGVGEVAALDLHPGFAASWPHVSSAVRSLTAS